MYKIVSIKRDGVERTDGRYPLRTGCTGHVAYLKPGNTMLFEYSKDADGNEKEGILSTSNVEDLLFLNGFLYVTTLNSEYTFEEM